MRWIFWFGTIVLLLFLLFGNGVTIVKDGINGRMQTNPKTTMQITSNAFTNEGNIPEKYTCDGEGINPPLTFLNVPERAQSLALIVEDPDVPRSIKPDGVWTHWLVWNMPTSTENVEEGSVPEGAEGRNTSDEKGYQGPCPPDTEHRYFFKLFALDTTLDLNPETATKKDLEQAMDGHISEQAELVGLYEGS